MSAAGLLTARASSQSPAQTSSETLALCSPYPWTSTSVLRLRQGCPCLVCRGWSEGWAQGHRQLCSAPRGPASSGKVGWPAVAGPSLRSRAGLGAATAGSPARRPAQSGALGKLAPDLRGLPQPGPWPCPTRGAGPACTCLPGIGRSGKGQVTNTQPEPRHLDARPGFPEDPEPSPFLWPWSESPGAAILLCPF